NGPIQYTISSYQVMQDLLKQCWRWGLVQIPVEKKQGRYGVKYEFDENTAFGLAKKALIEAEEKMITDYVGVQKARQVAGLAVMPPGGTVATVIERRRIDLDREFNLKPIGYGTVAKAAAASQETEALKQRIADLEAVNAKQMKMFEDMM